MKGRQNGPTNDDLERVEPSGSDIEKRDLRTGIWAAREAEQQPDEGREGASGGRLAT